jgi:hypothetical protein
LAFYLKVAGFVLVASLGAWLIQQVHAQGTRTVLDGVFTEAQAKRGEAAYTANCAKCHEGADVDGPTLEGTPFIDRWREDNLGILFTFLKTKMPADQPGSLSDSAYLDILTHLLKSNNYPGGAGELTTEALGGVLLVGKDGPQPLPTNALVQVVGCLTLNPAGAWTVASSSEPYRTPIADQITPEEKRNAGIRPPGSQTFRLQNLGEVFGFTPDAHNGHKVLAKGVLIRQAGNDRINVTALTEIAENCAP